MTNPFNHKKLFDLFNSPVSITIDTDTREQDDIEIIVTPRKQEQKILLELNKLETEYPQYDLEVSNYDNKLRLTFYYSVDETTDGVIEE